MQRLQELKHKDISLSPGVSQQVGSQPGAEGGHFTHPLGKPEVTEGNMEENRTKK